MKPFLSFAILLGSLPLLATPASGQPINVDHEIARVKAEGRPIMGTPPLEERSVKVGKYRAVINREIAQANAQLGAKNQTPEEKKALSAYVQKLRAMSAQLK